MIRLPNTSSPPEQRLDAAMRAFTARIPSTLATAMWDPDRCPVEWLPRLAKIFQVPVYSVEWDVADQRRVIAGHLTARQHAGTVAGIVAILDAGGALYEYREPADRPYEAEVDILNAGATTLSTAQLAEILQRTKRAAVKLTISQFASGMLDLPVRAGTGAAIVAEPFIGGL